MRFDLLFQIKVFWFALVIILSYKTQNILANEVPYIYINCIDSDPYEIKLNNEFCIKNLGDLLEIKTEAGDIELPIRSIFSMGFVYKNEEAGVNSIRDDKVEKMQIYDMEGRFIKETNSDSPDLSGLSLHKIYVIKKGSYSYKYIPYK